MKALLVIFIIALLVFFMTSQSWIDDEKMKQKHSSNDEQILNVEMTPDINADACVTDCIIDADPITDATDPSTDAPCIPSPDQSKTTINLKTIHTTPKQEHVKNQFTIPGVSQSEFFANKSLKKSSTASMRNLTEWNKKYLHSLHQKNSKLLDSKGKQNA